MANQFRVNTVTLTREQEKARVELLEALTTHLNNVVRITPDLAASFGTGDISVAIRSFTDYQQVITALRDYLDKHLIALNDYAKATKETDANVARGLGSVLDSKYGGGVVKGGAASATATAAATMLKPGTTPKPGKTEPEKKEETPGKGDEDDKNKISKEQYEKDLKRKDEELAKQKEEYEKDREKWLKERDELRDKIHDNEKTGKGDIGKTGPIEYQKPGQVQYQTQHPRQEVIVNPGTTGTTPTVTTTGRTGGFSGGSTGGFTGGLGKGREASPSTGLEAFDSALKAETLPEVPEVPVEPEIGASVSDSTIPGNLGSNKTLKGGLLAAGVGAAAAGAAAYSNYKKNKEEDELGVDYSEKSENGLDNQDDIFVNSDTQNFDSQDYYW